MKKLVLVMMLCGMLGILWGQSKIVYVMPASGGGNDANNGTGWSTAYATVGKALQGVASGTLIKVHIGTYTESELVVPAGVILEGGYVYGKNREDRVAAPAAETVLKAGGSHRVIAVNGKIDGFTIMGGAATGTNGGGAYVAGGGEVWNCIIKENIAVRFYPKVGDVMLKTEIDGKKFLDVGEITSANASQVVANFDGIVVWVNPDRTAPAGQQGWVFHTKKIDYLSLKKDPTAVCYSKNINAMEDTAGFQNTQLLLKNNPTSASLKSLQTLGAGWYLPAAGQVSTVPSQFKRVVQTINKLWEVLTSAQRKTFFGIRSNQAAANIENFRQSYWIYQDVQMLTSTRATAESMWGVLSMIMRMEMVNCTGSLGAGQFIAMKSF